MGGEEFFTTHTRGVDPDQIKQPDLGFRCAMNLE
jgi:hypothetical protein